MKENFLHIVSQTPCIVSVNGKFVGTIDNENCFELDLITKNNTSFLTYEPISNTEKLLPYTIMLNMESIKNNDYISAIPFPDNNFDIELNPYKLTTQSNTKALFNDVIGKYFISITSGVYGKFNIFSGNNLILSVNIPNLENVKVTFKNEILLMIGVLEIGSYYVLVIDTKNLKILYNDNCTSVTDDNIINIFKPINSLCKHAKVTAIDTANSNIDSYFVYEDNSPSENFHYMLKPFAFLECVKYDDETMAKSFLSSNYSNARLIDFKNYFGNIKEIYFNRHINSYAKLNYTIKSNTYKNYNFIMNNGKISDIEEVF